MLNADRVAERMAEVVREGLEHRLGQLRVATKDTRVWDKVREAGSRLWLDTGDMEEAERLWNSKFEALTVNNTLLNQEVQKGIYDGFTRKAASALRDVSPDIGDRELILELAFALNARHCLRLVELFDAHVSVELHTDLADDIEGTVNYGKRFHEICPERFYVKVPLTPAGFLAARKLEDAGVPVNFTLGFSARQNFLAALLARPSYVNVFLGRLNAFVADNKLGDGLNVGEKATLATQRQISKLRDAGKSTTHLIGASLREGSQVTAIAGVDVLTMPPKVAAQYQEDPADEVQSRVNTDPAVRLAPGIELLDFNASTLWDVPDSFKYWVEELLKKDIDRLSRDDLHDHFEAAGFGDLLPRWSVEELRTVTIDGKIPIHRKWKERLSSGKLGMDALLNISGLCAFATDQRALDERVRSLL